MAFKAGQIYFEDAERDGVRELFGSEYERSVYGEERVLDFLLTLRDVMERQSISQADLARRLNADRAQVSRWLSAKTGVRAATMFTLADALGYRLEMNWRPICEKGWVLGAQTQIDLQSVTSEVEPQARCAVHNELEAVA